MKLAFSNSNDASAGFDELPLIDEYRYHQPQEGNAGIKV